MNEKEKLIVYKFFEVWYDPIFFHNREIDVRKKDFPIIEMFMSISVSMFISVIFGLNFTFFISITSVLILFDILYSIYVYYVNRNLEKRRINIDYIDNLSDDVELINCLLDIFFLRKELVENDVELFHITVPKN